MAAADYRLLTEATGVRIAEALEDVTAMVGPKGDTGEVSEAELTAKLADKASAIVDTASGAIASFPDGAAVAAKDITIGIEPVQSGSGDPSPDNVRPISGWTGANVTRTGKNLINADVYYGNYKQSDGTYLIRPYDSDEIHIPLSAWVGKTVTFSFNVTVNASTSRICAQCMINGATVNSNYISAGASDQVKITVTPVTDSDYVIITYGSGGLFYSTFSEIQLELGSTATTYEAPNITIIPISWQSEAGTVYGGTLDVTKGELVVDRIKITDLSQYYWGLANIGDGLFICQDARLIGIANANSTPLCNKYKGLLPAVDNQEAHNLGNNMCCFRYPNFDRFYVNDRNYANVFDFKASLTNMELVYELATPQTYQLSPTEVTLLLGVNNVWADTGDTTVTYRADTKLYIQKINAPTDDDMVADAQIASGRYFIVGGNLYKSTTTIPAGDTITPGTNCILTNLADALNALNT